MSHWVVVGISGVTNGGKSTLTKKLVESLPGTVKLINQDDYFYLEDSQHHVPAPGGLMHHNWDIISSLDMERMEKDVLDIINSKIPEKSESYFDRGLTPHSDPSSSSSANAVHYHPVLLLDGFLLYDHKGLMDICNLRFFLTLTREQCWDRRKSRVYEPPDPPGYFDHCVWPMYEAHLKRIEKMPRVVFLDGVGNPYQEVYKKILDLAKVMK
ncbi:nicotinamide riboside kinase 2-like isoform X1 [Penaeus chinensis]|uniref:nicotinamide riboside kinase 2-like isoform X1 n=1 Tax=Penaeus chinensis TaxID=139456 RepID=UPI001FB5FFCD|nr:nicotinamide riboside kinase 2-like isoform X1 [Penaeus chinensis]